MRTLLTVLITLLMTNSAHGGPVSAIFVAAGLGAAALAVAIANPLAAVAIASSIPVAATAAAFAPIP